MKTYIFKIQTPLEVVTQKITTKTLEEACQIAIATGEVLSIWQLTR